MKDSSPDRKPRVRFAPSPTGHLHVGGARTALFNWLFARRHGGSFILRIEDSDLKRSDPALSRRILEELGWLGLDWDEGPSYQSERFARYRELAERLRDRGLAYREDSPGGGRALIYRVPEGEVEFRDLVYGPITVSTAEIKDIVLIKSDGAPAYNFACAVDDHDMKVDHVIRGDDHLPNTPKQILLWRALEWEPPSFAHLPLILGPDRAPLSKRHGAASVDAFRRDGFLPSGLRNYLALLGWSPGDDREVLATEELIAEFSLERVIKRAAIFDYRKLEWINSQHLRRLPPARQAELLGEYLKAEEGLERADRRLLTAVAEVMGERTRTLRDFSVKGGYFFRDDFEYDPEATARHWKGAATAELLSRLKTVFAGCERFTAEELEKALRSLVEEMGVKGGEVIHPLRVALTGMSVSPGIFETMTVLGRERVLARLDRALTRIKENGGSGEDATVPSQ